MSLPLEGIRILAFSQFGAGPYGTMQLADMGADVIKVENPLSRGDSSRGVPPLRSADGPDSVYFQSLNRNKKGLTLNLQHPGSREVLCRLVRASHAVYSNLRGDLPRKLGLTYEHLGAVNPAIVCCHLSGYGMDNPRSGEPAYDYVIQGETGVMALTGEPDGPPARAGIPIADFGGGLMSMVGLAVGIIQALRTGKGADIDVSLFDTLASMMTYSAAWYLTGGVVTERQPASGHSTLVPCQNFRTRDGWVAILCTKEEFYQRFCDLLEHPEWRTDPRFQTSVGRLEHRAELLPLVEAELRERTTGEVCQLLRGRVPCAPVLDFAQAMENPFLRVRDMIVEVEHPEFGKVRQMGSPIKFHGAERRASRAPRLGEHSDAILRDVAGYSADEVACLRREGVV